MFNFHFRESLTPSIDLASKHGALETAEKNYLNVFKSIISLHEEGLPERHIRYIRDFHTSNDDVENIADHLHHEPSAVSCLGKGVKYPKAEPSDHYKGLISLGGKNLRCAIVSTVSSKSEYQTVIEQSIDDISKALDTSKLTATGLFDFIAHCYAGLRTQAKIRSDLEIPVCFSTSHPLENGCISQLKVFREDKAMDDPIVGSSVSNLINFAFKRAGVMAKCVSVQHDSLVALAASPQLGIYPEAFCSISLGSGLDVAYLHFDETGNRTLHPINLASTKNAVHRSIVDHCHDFSHGSSRGFRPIERMVGGDGLAESVRISFVKIFQGDAPAKAFHRLLFSSDDIFSAINDKTSSHIVAQKILSKAFGTITTDMVDTFLALSHACIDRASTILAGVILGLARKSGRCVEGWGTATVMLEGQVFQKNPNFIASIEKRVKENNFGGRIQVKYYKDASIIGASVLVDDIC